MRLYVDGIPATMPDGQGQVSNFPLGAAERIESCTVRSRRSTATLPAASSRSSPPTAVRSPNGASTPPATATALGADTRGREGILGYNVDLSQFHTDGYRGHGYAERSNGNAKFTLDLGAGRKLTLLANTVALPNADDPLGLTRTQFETDPRQAVASAVQFDTRKSVHQQARSTSRP